MIHLNVMSCGYLIISRSRHSDNWSFQGRIILVIDQLKVMLLNIYFSVFVVLNQLMFPQYALNLSRCIQSWVQLHKITSITITLKYRLQLQLQLHHHNVILNYNYNYTMLISITITITVPFLRKCYFFMMEYWVNRFWVVFQFWPEHCVVTLPPLSLPTLFGSIISRHLISYMCGTSELDHTK